MRRRMTITLDKVVYDGLYRTIGKRRMSQFIEDLLCPHVLDTALDDGYRGLWPQMLSVRLKLWPGATRWPRTCTAKSERSMTKSLKAIPAFNSEAEERSYWEAHDSTEHLDWSKAHKVTLPKLKPSTRTISLRLPQHLLDSLKVAANARDVPYQSLIKVWLQEKLSSQSR